MAKVSHQDSTLAEKITKQQQPKSPFLNADLLKKKSNRKSNNNNFKQQNLHRLQTYKGWLSNITKFQPTIQNIIILIIFFTQQSVFINN